MTQWTKSPNVGHGPGGRNGLVASSLNNQGPGSVDTGPSSPCWPQARSVFRVLEARAWVCACSRLPDTAARLPPRWAVLPHRKASLGTIRQRYSAYRHLRAVAYGAVTRKNPDADVQVSRRSAFAASWAGGCTAQVVQYLGGTNRRLKSCRVATLSS